MEIHIDALTFDAIIGLLDFEREHTQKVVVTCHITYHYTSESFIDYAKVAQTIEETIKNGKFKLIEEALLSVESKLSKAFPAMETLSLRIHKPDILPHANVGLSASWNYKRF